MIDLHTHTLLSDGNMLPLELARRAKVKGYRILGISDHVDVTTIENVAASILKLLKYAELHEGIRIVPGAELTHCPAKTDRRADRHGTQARLLVRRRSRRDHRGARGGRDQCRGHRGGGRHPRPSRPHHDERGGSGEGPGVLLEITTRKGHSLTNGHVAKLARAAGAKLVINTDSHSPSDLVTDAEALKVVLGAGLGEEDFAAMQQNAEALIRKIAR
jgi:histidinol phosphatase-like PHP family hydrolase